MPIPLVAGGSKDTCKSAWRAFSHARLIILFHVDNTIWVVCVLFTVGILQAI
jgi:hypothetical protein